MKKNVASQVVGAQMIAAADGSAFTGAVTVHVTGDGGTQAVGTVGAGACAHEGNGFHTYAPAQAETNFDHVAFTFVGTGAIPVTVQVYTSFPQTGDNFARIGAPAGASVSADIAAVKAKTDNLPSDPADQSLIIAATDALSTAIAGVQADTDNIQTRLPAALVGGRIDASVGAMANDVVTAAAIAPDAIGASELAASAIAEIADGVWDEAISGHLGAGSTGNALNAAGSAGDPWSTPLPGAYGDGTAGKIIGDNVNATISSRASQTSVDDLPTNAELATALAAADDPVLAQVALVKAKTDALPADPADQSDIIAATNALGAAIAGVQSDTDNIQTRLPAALVGGRMDASVGAVNGDATAAANLAKTTRAIGRGTAAGGATTTSIPTSAFTPAGATADQFKGRIITFDADTATVALRGQSTDITASSGVATPTLTVTALTTPPAAGDTFSVT